jgi:hypothetical protein
LPSIFLNSEAKFRLFCEDTKFFLSGATLSLHFFSTSRRGSNLIRAELFDKSTFPRLISDDHHLVHVGEQGLFPSREYGMPAILDLKVGPQG